MLKKLLLSLSLPLLLSSQTTNPFDSYFSVTKSTSLSGTAEVVTIQHPVTVTRSVKFIGFYMYCSVACTVTLERSGTAATSTALAIVNQNPNNTFVQTSTSTAFSASNVGTGTVINLYNISAGGFVWVDGSTYQLPSNVADNLTMRTNSITGNVVLMAQWREL